MIQRTTAGGWWVPYAIGLGYGLVASMIGIAQWVLTARDLAAREAAFQAVHLRFPVFDDATNVARGNEWFWVYTAVGAGVVMLVVYLLAAFTACGVSPRRHDGVVAARMAAIVSGMTYFVATIVAIAASPVQDITESLVPCELVFGLVVFGTFIPLAHIGASMGISARRFFSRGRRAL